MNKSKHTPGPWSVFKDKELEIWNQNTHIATIQGHHEFKDDVDNKANARLISAAPEMLVEIERYLSIAEREGWYATITTLNVILNKIKGE